MRLRPPLAAARQRGIALVLVLLLIVLATVIVVSFLSGTLSERQVSESSAGITRADAFTQGALETLQGHLKQEINAGSTSYTSGGVTVYAPNVGAMRPAISGVSSTSNVTNNLLKRSAGGAPFYAGSNYTQSGPTLASTVSTTTPSSEGRAISAARWNKPLLMPPANPGSGDLTPAADFTPPDWIYVARDGSNPTSWSNALRYSNSSDSSVIGRYAFVIYDEGGLLDANVAGFPSTLSGNASEIGAKGSLAWADLTRTGLASTTVDRLITWRNEATGITPLEYTRFARNTTVNGQPGNPRPGFVRPAYRGNESNRLFISRQQLIRFLDPNGTDATAQGALSFLGTFSREVDAPSWLPTTPSASSVNYATESNTAGKANRFVPNVRAPGDATLTRYRTNGTSYQYQVRANDPFVQRRFNLQRISWLDLNGPPTGVSAAAIRSVFGLSRNGDYWVYTGSTGTTVASSIQTLDQVAQQGREPNFFELLKAALLRGSLGIAADLPISYGPGQPTLNFPRQSGNGISNYDRYAGSDTRPNPLDLHVLQIGANIIDQYDADSYPTLIQALSLTGLPLSLAGIEGLPYIHGMAITPYCPDTGTGTRNIFNVWVEPLLWQLATFESSPSAASQPETIRVSFDGRDVTGSPTGSMALYAGSSGTPNLTSFVNRDITITSGGSTPWSAIPKSPTLVRDLSAQGASISTSFPRDFYTESGVTYVGFWLGNADISPNQWDVNVDGVTPVSFVLKVKYPSGEFLEVQRLRMGGSSGITNSGSTDKFTNANRRTNVYGFTDPRSARFGVYNYDVAGRGIGGDAFNLTAIYNSLGRSDAWGPGLTKVSTLGARMSGDFGQPKNFPGGIWSAWGTFGLALNAGSGLGYTDRDGVQRPADGITSGGTTIYPQSSTLTTRPIMLNRPFRSVGEMAYAHRDLPWRSLDFASASSADAALLDFFALDDSDEGTPSPNAPAITLNGGLRAGVINLNSAQTRGIEALVAGTIKAWNENATPRPALGATEAQAVVQALTNLNPRPLLNKSEIVTRLVAGMSASGDDLIKERREAPLRALADASQIRTWNLFIDLIGQVGRFGPSASQLNQFTVEGERRLWAHVALDRFTGQVVDIQIEHVRE